MTSPSLSLGPVLDLIERWQFISGTVQTYVKHLEAMRELSEVDIPALRALAEQHAAQLREEVTVCDSDRCAELRAAAADFLAAPRRDDTS